MKFNIEVEINTEQLCEKIEKKAEREISKTINDELEKRVIEKLDGRFLDQIIGEYVDRYYTREIECAVERYLGNYSYSGPIKTREELQAFYLGSTCHKLRELVDDAKLTPEVYAEQVIETTAQLLSKRLIKSKSKMINLANLIAEEIAKEEQED